MKATLEIPDDLYRRVKARSAMEGRPMRSVAVQLFQNWLDALPAPEGQPTPPRAYPCRARGRPVARAHSAFCKARDEPCYG